MTHAWEAEIVVSPDLAIELIYEQFPELKPKDIQLLGIGWDNTAYLINEALVFRFPRREMACLLLQTEFQAMPTLSRRLSLLVPIPKWLGSSSVKYKWPFLGYQKLAGQTACEGELTDEERTKAAKPLAHFMLELHSTPRAVADELGLKGDFINKLNHQKLKTQILKNYQELLSLQLVKEKNTLYELIEQADSMRQAVATTVVHGDFYARHLLVDERHHLTGVIDWGDLHIGDPAVDLSIVHSFLPPSAHLEFRNSYGTISEETWQLARLRALFHSSTVALYGHHTSDTAIAKEGFRAISYILE